MQVCIRPLPPWSVRCNTFQESKSPSMFLHLSFYSCLPCLLGSRSCPAAIMLSSMSPWVSLLSCGHHLVLHVSLGLALVLRPSGCPPCLLGSRSCPAAIRVSSMSPWVSLLSCGHHVVLHVSLGLPLVLRPSGCPPRLLGSPSCPAAIRLSSMWVIPCQMRPFLAIFALTPSDFFYIWHTCRY